MSIQEEDITNADSGNLNCNGKTEEEVAIEVSEDNFSVDLKEGKKPVSAEENEEFTEENLTEWLDSLDEKEDVQDPDKKPKSEDVYFHCESEDTCNIADLEAKIKDLETKLAETNDQLLRKAADFENFRKRITQEKLRSIEFANESLLLDIIPVIDDFERAIQSAEMSKELAELPAGKAMLDGITMIEKRLISRLESNWGLKRFNSAGQLFDPNIHEAMLMEKSPDVEEAVIAEDLIKGYMLKDRVIRAAKVKVLMPEESG